MEKGYQFHRNESLADSLHRICAWQTGRMTKILRDETVSLQERVHDTRKRIKETRALLRLFRGSLGDAFGETNRSYRDAGRELAPYRDATTVVETVRAFPPRLSDAVGRKGMGVLRHLVDERHRAQLADLSALRECLESLPARLADANVRLAAVPLPERKGFAIIEDELARTVSDGRRAMGAAYKSGHDAAFHEWRKRVKDHAHHIELLTNVWPKVMTALEKEISVLAQHLGCHHDLAVVAGVVREAEATIGSTEVRRIDRLLTAQRMRTANSACPIGERIYAIRPREIGRAIAALWDRWHA